MDTNCVTYPIIRITKTTHSNIRNANNLQTANKKHATDAGRGAADARGRAGTAEKSPASDSRRNQRQKGAQCTRNQKGNNHGSADVQSRRELQKGGSSADR